MESLLVLQERDMRRLQMEAQLVHIPSEVASLRKQIEEEKEALEAARKKVMELEVRRKELDNEVQGAEVKINQYKNQQLQVKKNEEYQALNHEIEVTGKKIGELEEAEIALMLEIVEQQAGLEEKKQASAKRIELLQSQIADLEARKINLDREIEEARVSAEEAEQAADPAYLKAYLHSKTRVKRPPFVVPLDDLMCSGCHLKVTTEIQSNARKGREPVHCNSCGRVVYWP